MKPRLPILLKSILLPVFAGLSVFTANAKNFAPVAYLGHGSYPFNTVATDINLADYANGDRFHISYSQFLYAHAWTFSLGGPVTITLSEDRIFSGYSYDYTPHHVNEVVPVFGSSPITGDVPVFGNVFQDSNQSSQLSSPTINLIQGNSTQKLEFNDNHSTGTNAGNRVALKGGAVSFLQHKTTFKDLDTLSFVGNSLHNENEMPVGERPSSSENVPHAEGGAAYIRTGTFQGIKNFIFAKNSATSDHSAARGGALYLQIGTFDDLATMSFSENTASSEHWTDGGALCVTSTGTFSNMDEVLFSDNSVYFYDRSGVAYGGAVAGLEGGGKHTWFNITRIVFENNRVHLADTMTGTTRKGGHGTGNGRLWGGAYYYPGQVIFQNSGQLQFINNQADARSDADIISDVRGGAITTGWALVINNIVNTENDSPSVLFSGNSALRNTSTGNKSDARGGAVDSSYLYIHDSGDVLFENNYATDLGGAIHFEGSNTLGVGSSLYLVGDQGDITFKGNTHQLSASNEGNSGIANAIFITPTWDNPYTDFGGKPYDTVLVAAQEGNSINFFDPIASDKSGTTETGKSLINSYEKLRIQLGAGPSGSGTPSVYTGTIRFSGEFAEETLAGSEASADYEHRLAASKTSSFDGSVNLLSGTLILEHGAIFGKRSEAPEDPNDKTGTVHRLRGGVLDITGSERHGVSSLTGNLIQFSDTEITTLRAGAHARFDANIIDMSGGVTVDLAHYFSGTSVLPLRGVEVKTESLYMSGDISIADANNVLEYYENTRWRDRQTFTLFNVTGATFEDADASDFLGVISSITGTPEVLNCGYDGDWSYENRDGNLVAIWTPKGWVPPVDPDPEPEPTPDPDPTPDPSKSIRPELAGALVLNSLSSTVSNMKSLGKTALGQAGRERFFMQKDVNYWVSGLGDFSSHRTVGVTDGYDYTGFGYSIGADTKLSNNFLVGFAFGNMYGKNKSRNYSAHIDQSSYMSMIYGAWINELDKENYLNVSGSASYGITNNKLDTFYSDGERARGKWDNDALRLTLRGEWNHSLSNNWVLTPFLGVEYDDAEQKSFTETGDKARDFGRGNLKNLALPVGVQISRIFDFSNGMKWSNALALSYVPDVYRENPEADVLRTTNGYTWTAQGVKPVRNAGRVEYSTRLAFDQTWSIFAGYSLEGRSNALYHNANIGVSVSF